MGTNELNGETLGATLSELYSRLKMVSDTPQLDAQGILAHVLGWPRSSVLAHPEVSLTESQGFAMEGMVGRLEAGEPLPYILGAWEFFGMKFEVTPDVLIPRPETEMLVERAIAWLRKNSLRSQDISVMDVATGCGCIAISLAVNVTGISLIATDVSQAALKVARRNAERMNVSACISFLEADLFPTRQKERSLSLIVANPPYIPTKTLRESPVFGREPAVALDGGPDGLVFIHRIIHAASHKLIPGGLLLLEIEVSEGSAVLSIASETFPNSRVQLYKDLAGHDRMLEVQL